MLPITEQIDGITGHFIAMGDGGSGLPAQQKIADRLLRHYDEQPFSLVLLLGDNIYPNGDTIRYGENRFTSLYQPLLDRGVQFRPILGNHDIAGPLGVGYPKLWMSNQRENMQFFNMATPYYDFVLGKIHFFMLNTNRLKKSQRSWLETAMQDSPHALKIVCGHHPVFSSGFHGSTGKLVEKLRPILENQGALLYLSAHEHDYERFAPVNAVHYIVSGGGGADLRPFRRRPLDHSLVRISEHHFLSCHVKPHGLSVHTINADGAVIDASRIETTEQRVSAYQTAIRQFTG